MGNLNTVLSASYSAVSKNEVGGRSSIAYSISPPIADSATNGNGGWTIGFNQEDFNKNFSQASATLTNALVASGQFNATNAQLIAIALHNAGTSSNANLTGITDVSGQAVTVENINTALQTSAAQNSINTASLNDFTTAFNSLNSTVFQNASLSLAVKNAFADSTQGALLETVLADYNNQYNISPSGNMMQLLTSGKAYNESGVLQEETTTGSDGSATFATFANGINALFQAAWDKNGNVTQQTTSSNITYQQFANAAATALATQVIAQFLFKNHYTASIAAQATATATINTLLPSGTTATQGFMDNYAFGIANILGSIGGSAAGASLFKELGLSQQVGAVLGNAANDNFSAVSMLRAV